ncbi:hypothetical protein CEXT_54531, partial [Caerostris extrusa]
MLSPFKIPEVCLAAAERNQWQPGENEDSIGIVCKDRSVDFRQSVLLLRDTLDPWPIFITFLPFLTRVILAPNLLEKHIVRFKFHSLQPTLFESLAKSPSDGEMLSPFKIPEVCLAGAERNQWQRGENEDSIGTVCKDRSVGFQTISLLTVTQ